MIPAEKELKKNIEVLVDKFILKNFNLNMPCKNGMECLAEIKSNRRTKKIPVIIHSTAAPDWEADQLYENGAHYYMRKDDLSKLIKSLEYVFTQIKGKTLSRPARNKFIITSK